MTSSSFPSIQFNYSFIKISTIFRFFFIFNLIHWWFTSNGEYTGCARHVSLKEDFNLIHWWQILKNRKQSSNGVLLKMTATQFFLSLHKTILFYFFLFTLIFSRWIWAGRWQDKQGAGGDPIPGSIRYIKKFKKFKDIRKMRTEAL